MAEPSDGARRTAAAFVAVPREAFLPADVRPLSHEDRPLPIGHGATNSQPWTVRYMLTALDVRPGDRVLDVGSGSGWTTALLAHLAGPNGSVIGVDIVEALVAMGRANLADRWPTARVELARSGVLGWPDGAPYDRILVSADGGRVPAELEAQLGASARMVIPAASEMWIVQTDAERRITRHRTGDLFSFVPLR